MAPAAWRPLLAASAWAAASAPSALAATFLRRAEVSPVEKVIELLGRLQTQIQEEGAKEAAEYDKFACFCKDQVSVKTYAIEKSEAKIEELDAKISVLGTEITVLDGEVVELGTRIGVLETDISAEEDARKTENEAYLAADENVTGAIAAVEAAIKTLEASKRAVGFGQLSQEARAKLAKLSALRLPEKLVRATAALLQTANNPGEAAGYKYQSSSVIEMLHDLRTSFVQNKKDLDTAEFEAKATSEKKVLGWADEKMFKEKSKTEKEQMSAEKTVEKQALEKDKGDETVAKDADVGFRDELTSQCKTKAEEWDQRSTSRAAELTAIAEATEILKSGVASTYDANKKLVGLAAIRRSKIAPAPRAAAKLKQVVKPVSLLQVAEANSEPGPRALAQLATAATSLGSSELRALLARASLVSSEDHFVKVRGLINDLIARLEAEASAEADQKTFCDGEMSKAVADRDKHALGIEESSAKLATEESKKAQLVREIDDLTKQVAELRKALQEATILRAQEKEDNDKTVAEAKEGKAAVENAITILEAYYGKFVQVGASQTPADRDGNSVSDLAPKTSFSGDYNGKKDASTGIMGLLQVILSDFDRTVTTVADAETSAASAFDTFKSETDSSISTKEGAISGKQTDLATAEVEIVAAKDGINSSTRLHETALKELEKLQVMCVMGEESYAERSAKREKEIQALREALAILDSYKA